MLTQRMGKCFLYLTKDKKVKSAASSKLKSSLLFEEGLRILDGYSPNVEIDTKLAIVKELWSNYKELLESDYNENNAKQVLAINTDILSACNDVVIAIEKYTKASLASQKKPTSSGELAKTINISGRQRMLSQRLTLYYMAYYAKYTKDIDDVEKVYTLFDDSLTWLIASSYNDSDIDLEDVSLFLGTDVIPLSDIKAGEHLDETKSISPFERTALERLTGRGASNSTVVQISSASTGPAAVHELTPSQQWDYNQSSDEYMRHQFIDSILSNSYYNGTGTYLPKDHIALVAWSDQDHLETQIEGEDTRKTALTMYFFELPIE